MQAGCSPSRPAAACEGAARPHLASKGPRFSPPYRDLVYTKGLPADGTGDESGPYVSLGASSGRWHRAPQVEEDTEIYQPRKGCTIT